MTALINDNMFLFYNIFLINDVRFDAIFFTQLRYSHVKREGNKIAHSLAWHALCILDFIVWMENVSPLFLFVIQVDIAGFS